MLARMHRLFFALSPDADLVARIVALGEGLPEAGGRRTRPDKLHLTLVFLGDADPELARRAGARVAARVAAFDFALEQSDSFHGGTWILRASSAPFDALQAALAFELQAHGVPVHDESRAFIPHVTLRRRAANRLPRQPIVPIEWKARALCLYDSHLDSGEYERLGQWPLAGDNAGAH